jgi:acyl carrier protein
MAFEEEYAISIPDDLALQLCSVDKMVQYIEKTKA